LSFGDGGEDFTLTLKVSVYWTFAENSGGILLLEDHDDLSILLGEELLEDHEAIDVDEEGS
jgi:hypothetical protein